MLTVYVIQMLNNAYVLFSVIARLYHIAYNELFIDMYLSEWTLP